MSTKNAATPAGPDSTNDASTAEAILKAGKYDKAVKDARTGVWTGRLASDHTIEERINNPS
jgi:hypothetical protein